MTKGIRRQVMASLINVTAEIASMSDGFYGGGLASEGYAGGYAQALRDVLLALNGVPPNTSYWVATLKAKETEKKEG